MTRPEPRPGVTAMPPYVAGRPPPARPGLTTYKLSSNENPYPPLPGVLSAAARALPEINRYPDLANTELVAALAAGADVPREHIAVATGSTGLIYQLFAAYAGPGDEIVHPWRSFEAYPIAVLAAGATGVPVPNLPDGRHDLDGLAAAIGERTKVVVLCTPNNPNGPALTRREVDALLDRVPEHVVVLLDEAYSEFVRMPDPVDGIATYRSRQNVVVMRTFSKAYGLAGLRVGYAIAPEPIAAALRAIALPFGVNAIAQEAAVASLGARAELLARVDALVDERDRVVAGLRAAGWAIPEPQGNFVWFDLAERPAAIPAFVAAAGERGIVVRPLGADGVRVTIGEPEANTRLLDLARAFPRAEHGG